ncbi:hypothetical protein QYE76_006320 [Lolium multiflorum]|uniref:Transposon protein n=1 Tax=Lolium multiflorum TaxID=4521 RepID=A0AAD8RVF1_LOLMU|nr:hypothetical protein QYE76_006320 [Lolium multiflorum]
MQDNQARPAPSNGAHEDHVERDDYHHEEDYHHADGDYHHEEEVGGEDHHEEEDAGGEHHHDEEEDSGATPLISALRDSHVQDLLLQETSNDRVAARERAKLSQMEKDGMTPIFPGCRPQDTRLHVTLDYLQMKTQNKWTDSSFSKNLKFWHDRLPEGNTLPSSTEEAKKVVCPLDLPHEKYHACINDCVIYRCEYKDRTTCPVCGHGRYKVGNKKVPRKVVWYFPITPRLQRYFVDPKEAKLMQWHAERQKPEEDPEMGYMLTHPSDAGQWQALDIAFPRFGGDARNIRLGMSTDGLNPFGNQSSTHSTWPVFVWPYNLPPWLCTKQRYIHLSILIQGPKQPGVDMHLYLGLLKEELDTLWKTPPRTWDAYTRTYFDMRAALITTVTDYPGYAYVSAQVGHGFNGCVKCMDDTPHLQLPRDPGSSKTVYPGARRWLRLDHPWRKRGDLFNGKDEPDGPPRPRSGAEIDDLLKNWKECPAPGKKRPKPEPLLGVWKARSVFHDLEYWKVLHTPHSLDVMHITKNVTESLLGTLCNSEKSKDGPKARYDLKHFGIRKDLQAPDTDDDDDDDEQTEGTQRLRKRAKKNAVQLPAACFTTSPEELEQFFRCLLGVKVPHGYSGNIRRYLDVAKKRFTGMKSHDCHVLMTQILPVAIRGIMDEHVRDTLFGLCNFFDVITRKSIGVRQLKMLQDEIVVILCELEIYFPPAFCDICVHLLLHVVEDIKQLGPTFLHNMMPFERQNGVMKGYVRNRARPDASMAKGFLTYECISFCQNYLSTEDDEDHVGLPPRTHLGRLAGVGHREGYRSVHVGIENRRDDFDRAHRVALQHLKLTEPFVQEHKSMVEQNYIDMGRPRKMGDVTKKHNSSFTRWFKQTQLVEAQRNTPSTEDEKLIYTLSQGPAHNVRTYQGYDINGYRFYTEEKDRNSENQNSGVTMLSYADDETNVKERFFGRIEEIWELNYCGETVPMFRVRWAKKVEKEGRYFTTMVIPDAKSKNASAKNEPWVLGSQVDQCFFITDPSRPSRVVVRRGKRSIIGMQGDANEEDLDKNGDPKMEEEFDRHFDMPTTSKRQRRATTAKRRHQAAAAEEEEEGDRHAATEQDPQARAAAAQIKEEEDRHAAAEEEDRHAAAEEEEEDNAATTTTLNRRRSVRAPLPCPHSLVPLPTALCPSPIPCSRLCSAPDCVLLQVVVLQVVDAPVQINMSGNTSKPRSQNEEAREANKDFWEGYEQPRKAAAESPDDEEEGRDAASEEEVRDTAADTGDDDDTWDDAAQTGEETTGEENAANRTEGDSGGNPQEGKKKRTARRPRRDRRPQVLANVTDAVTVVSESGLPMEPSWVAKGYGMQLGCIVRETVPILTQDLRSKENEAIAQSLLQKLHQRYTFPEPFNKKVDSLALTKMSTALSSWKNRLKRKIEAGESWERISSKDPSLSLEDFNAFKSYLESDAVKKWTAWGKKMRDLNLGTHHCGSGGYRGKQPTWDKEDAEMVRLGKENPWHKIQDEQARNFVRSRYYLDWKTGQFITEHEDVRDFEKYLDEELTKAGPSSQGSTEPWDTPFNRAMNKYKERELDKPPTSGGRVSGFGTSMKLSEYYGSDAKTRKLERRSSAKDKSEVQELKKKVETLEKLVAEKPVENTEMMKKLLDEKIRQIIPPGLMEGLAAWNAGGQVGPIHVPSISGSNSSFHVSPTVPLHPTPASGLHQTPPQLQPPPQLQLVASTPPTAALVSTVAEIDAIKEDEPCILLQTVEPGGKLVEVASGLVMASRVMHGARLAEDVAKVKFVWGGGLPSGKKSTGATSPIIRPKIASADDTLKETAVAAPTTLKEPAVAAATRKEPTIAVTTRRHKQLLGALPQRPSTRRTVRQATASQPPPPKVQDMAPLDGNDVEDDDDIDAYINTGACSQDMYMPPMDEQAFRTHSDQLSRPPTVTKQRLVFTGLSQDTPPEAGNPAQVKPATVFSPNTLRKTIIGEPPKSTPATSEAPPAPEAPPSAPQAPPVGQVKKGRKRGAKKGASSSQPAPKRIRADDMVPPTPDGLPRCHEAGKPILPPDMEHLASGPMLPLQHSIQYQESVLLKEKDPNYPVFSVKVPSDQHFVNEDPADIFFIAFEDVFNLFHSKRLDYNLLQDGSSTRTKAVRYLESFMLMNKEKNTILLPVFPEDKYCTLIILCPKWSLAQYFDSSNTTTKKDYRRIRGVLDEAILGYSKNGGTFDKKGEFVRPDTKKLGFKHVIDFPCIKQPAGSIKEAFYVLHHLKGFVEDAEMMSLPPSKRDPIKMSGEINDDDLREDFHRLQMMYYVVFEGRVPGVYEEWEECKKQVHKFSGNCYKGYPTRHEAVAKWRAHQAKKSKMKTFLVLSLLLTIVAAVLYFILV